MVQGVRGLFPRLNARGYPRVTYLDGMWCSSPHLSTLKHPLQKEYVPSYKVYGTNDYFLTLQAQV
jgi:hypothetical protein